MRKFVFLGAVLFAVLLLTYPQSRASSGSNHEAVCYNFSGKIVYTGQISDYNGSATGVKFVQTNGKKVMILLASCVILEQ